MGAASSPGNFDECALKSTHEQARRKLAQAFWNGAPVEDLVQSRARVVDELALVLWSRSCAACPQIALVATGGYGRGELHPYSDIDLAVLTPPGAPRETHDAVAAFIAAAWDAGLELGHAVRTVDECVWAAREDVGITTALMEARLLAGPNELFEQMREATGSASIWPADEFFHAKLAEQAARHARYHDTAYNLEPNLKEGPGGLRDAQTVVWIAQRQFQTRTLHDLISAGFLSPEEHEQVQESLHQLWAIRYGLHLVAGRAEERLLFDHQRELARRFGYQDEHRRNLGVEQFMRHYFRTVSRLGLLNDLLLQRYRENLLPGRRAKPTRFLDARFAVQGKALAIRDDKLFQREPAAMLAMFRVLARETDVDGVSANTLRLLCTHRDEISSIRGDPSAQQAFMGLLREPQGVARELQRMNRFGVLGRYLPAFGRIVGHMQYDLFHAYTVDQHTLFVVRNLRRFAKSEFQEQFPLACDTFKRLDKPELLYLAGLFHDIAKGRGGDHSELGAEEAQRFAQQHGLPHADAHLIAWLVRNHLLMSATAQRRDISDPAVINDFAQQVADRRHLDHLYLLTVADIGATSPKLWNSWKDRLLTELYTATRYALRRGLEHPIDREEWIVQTRDRALTLLGAAELEIDQVEAIWQHLPRDCFLRLEAEQIAWQTHAVVLHESKTGPLVTIRHAPNLGSTELFIYTQDLPHLFANIVATLENMRLNVVAARVITTADGFAWDSFLVLDAAGRPLNQTQGTELQRRLKTQLSQELSSTPRVTRATTRRLKHFAASPQIEFSAPSDASRTQLAMVTSDRPGLLAHISRAFSVNAIQVHDARIATFGERVEDFFTLSTRAGKPVDDPALQNALREELLSLLNANQTREQKS